MTFKDQLAADRAVFLNPDEYGVKADLGEGADPRYADFLLDELPSLVEGEAAKYRTATRSAQCWLGDIEGTAVDDTVIIEDTEYKITDIQPNGDGWATLILTSQG